MAKFKVKITQVFKTTRTIVVEVEADDLASAIEEIDSGALTGPSFDDPDWQTGWDLQNEEVEAA
jgi:hypothetical protein